VALVLLFYQLLQQVVVEVVQIVVVHTSMVYLGVLAVVVVLFLEATVQVVHQAQ
jgi:hypothetical protein